MSMPATELQARALDLPRNERARLVEVLLTSFEPLPEIQSVWIGEAANRRLSVQNGGAKMVPGDEALARVRKRLF